MTLQSSWFWRRRCYGQVCRGSEYERVEMMRVRRGVKKLGSTYRLLEGLAGVRLQAGLWEALRLSDHAGLRTAQGRGGEE